MNLILLPELLLSGIILQLGLRCFAWCSVGKDVLIDLRDLAESPAKRT
jgi:hypothetical protein